MKNDDLPLLAGSAKVTSLDGQLFFVFFKECRCESSAEVMSLDGRLMVRAGFNGPSTLLAD